MTTYKYDALSPSGVAITGVISARDKGDAVIKLKDTCSVIKSLREIKEKNSLLDTLTKPRIREKALALVCKQFAIILTAGLPIVKTVELVANQAEDKAIRNLLLQVSEDVQAGYTLASSFSFRSDTLPTTFIETIRAGEESGALETAFERLSTYFSKKSKVRSKVISALTYPAFVLVVAVIVIGVIMIYAVPQFTTTFVTMGVELPFATKALIAASDFLSNWFLFILIFIAAAIILLRIYGKTERGGIALAKFRLKLPVLGKVQLMNAASQFAGTLSTMLAAGLPAVRALAVTGKALSNRYLGNSVIECVTDIESGFRIGDSMRKKNAFPELLTEMTAVGEESGSMEDTLRVIGEYYDNEVETSTARAVGLLEPIIICVLAVFVVFVLLAVYMPMFSMYGNIG